ncbi:hypothetical protein [Paenibacillus humicus]|uniref:hypothetical protein n=1 Tax=Paenibacillus humicus TaxID=412861 RepID=UPI000FD9AE44|nr:hypothetical protein [Paenibacillus humicus]
MGESYKEAFVDAVRDIIAQGIEDRPERIAAINGLTEAYVEDIGERPDAAQLERLADYILREELADPNPYKMTHEEYPFMSEWQFELRRDRETGMKAAEYAGTDGRDHRKPTKRRRTNYENWRVDKDAHGRNKARQDQYKRDTSPGPLITYSLRDTGGEFKPEFTEARTQAGRWHRLLAQG